MPVPTSFGNVYVWVSPPPVLVHGAVGVGKELVDLIGVEGGSRRRRAEQREDQKYR
jgi:hypothetical protein